MKRLAIVALLVAVASCADLTGPTTGPMVDGTRRFTPPSRYRELWADVEKCSGLSRSFDEIVWYEVPGALEFSYEGKAYVGLYQYPGIITMAGEVEEWDSDVAHEMLHALLRGGADHPAEYFDVKCKGVVAAP